MGFGGATCAPPLRRRLCGNVALAMPRPLLAIAVATLALIVACSAPPTPTALRAPTPTLFPRNHPRPRPLRPQQTQRPRSFGIEFLLRAGADGLALFASVGERRARRRLTQAAPMTRLLPPTGVLHNFLAPVGSRFRGQGAALGVGEERRCAPPAGAGDGVDDDGAERRTPTAAYAGSWIPAYAGMTDEGRFPPTRE